MKTKLPILCSMFLFCATVPIDERNTNYYWDNSIDNNVSYFKKVSEHFGEIGYNIDEENLVEYKSAIFFASIPPVADIYADTIYLGKTNLDVIYYKPGIFTLRFVKGKKEKIQSVVLLKGPNRSQMIRLE